MSLGFQIESDGGGSGKNYDSGITTLLAGVPKDVDIPEQADTNYNIVPNAYDEDGDPVIVKIDPTLKTTTKFTAYSDWDCFLEYNILKR